MNSQKENSFKSLTLGSSKATDTEELANFRIVDALTTVLKESEKLTVHIVPGENDATNCALPQQPLHGSFLSNLWKTKRLNMCTR